MVVDSETVVGPIVEVVVVCGADVAVVFDDVSAVIVVVVAAVACCGVIVVATNTRNKTLLIFILDIKIVIKRHLRRKLTMFSVPQYFYKWSRSRPRSLLWSPLVIYCDLPGSKVVVSETVVVFVVVDSIVVAIVDGIGVVVVVVVVAGAVVCCDVDVDATNTRNMTLFIFILLLETVVL